MAPDARGAGRRVRDDGSGAEPAVIIFGRATTQLLGLARAARARWHECELVFVAAACYYDALRALLARAPMIGPYCSALSEGDVQLQAVLEAGLRNALRRARMRTTLDKANRKLAKVSESRQIDDAHFQRLSVASFYLSNFLGPDAGRYHRPRRCLARHPVERQRRAPLGHNTATRPQFDGAFSAVLERGPGGGGAGGAGRRAGVECGRPP